LLDPSYRDVVAPLECAAEAFAVRDTRIEGGAIVVEFTRPPAAEALEAGRYELAWNGERLGIASAVALDAVRVRLVPAPEVRFVGRGIPYVLRIDAALRGLDGTPLSHPGIEYRLRVEGVGAPRVFAYPNPVRPADAEVVFAEVTAETRVRIFNLEGELVRELSGGVGGGLRWDLRGGRGQRLPSGVYLYVATDTAGSAQGRLVLKR
jgi:hypothetical protein